VKDAVPNILPSYYALGNSNTFNTTGNSSDNVNDPTDLDFHPNGDLWIVNRGTENDGGSTVKFSNPGAGNQNATHKQDQNAYHFMSLPTGIAFNENGDFGTSTGVYDANHDGGEPFTGPSLWSSDPAIYAVPNSGNGSHLDMLHASPTCMGIASEKDNRFWVTDQNSGDIVMYDFKVDHGPGNSNHDDGEILRYPSIAYSWVNANVPSHLEFQKSSQMLFIVDGGGSRILRLDVNSGSIGGSPSFNVGETLAQYANVSSPLYDVIVSSGLVDPSGIDVIDDRMIVSDNANGDIVIYDISTTPAIELGRIQTGDNDVMGVAIGPEGRIWYVDGNANKVVKIEPSEVIASIDENQEIAPRIYPNPVKESFYVETYGSSADMVDIYDISGKLVHQQRLTDMSKTTVSTSGFQNGVYLVRIIGQSNVWTSKITVAH